jgi:hypothetical protein
MHRPTLILRRFGPLTFGLGYYDDGIWVDHVGLGSATPRLSGNGERGADLERVDAVHEWYSCCADAAEEGPIVTDPLDGEMAPMLRVAGQTGP